MQHGQHIDSSSVAAVDPDHVDALLASELNDMTIGERETVYEQIHGVERKLVETAKSRSEALQEMDDKFKSDGVGCRYLFYRRALQENPSYTKDPALWLMFLRAELFDVSSAAIRLEKFLEAKVEFFGASSIARPITIAQDFDADDLKWLESGIQQILPARDRSGRAIMADFNMVSMQDMQPKKIESLVRCGWIFLFML